MKQKQYRTRNFATVVYPESAPENWVQILSDMCIPALISPIHDSDNNPTGERKKAHYHTIIMFDGVKTQTQAKEVFEQIGGVGCEIVQSIRGYARYLCHLDNPEKHQYDVNLVRSLSGADYLEIIELASSKYLIIGEMMSFCDDNGCDNYALLCSWARNNRPDWFRVLCDSGSFVMMQYLKSKNWTNTKKN